MYLLYFLVFFPMAAALALWGAQLWKPGRPGGGYLVCVAAAELLGALALLFMQGASVRWEGFCALGIGFCADGLRTVLAILAALLWLLTALLSGEYFAGARRTARYYFFYLFTLGALMGVFLSRDMFTTFIFFEIMSFTSYVWVAQNETAAALRAAQTYLAVAVIGGLVLLMGLFLLQTLLGTLEIGALRAAAGALEPAKRGTLYAAGACALFGFGAKAGMFPLHIWLPKAHPVAPAPASALLSGILTKSGVFGILAVSCGLFFADADWGLLITLLGTVTMVLGAVLAVFSVDLKRTLACSSMSQIGFILIGVGMQCLLGEENLLAAWGTVLHMVNHGLIKLVLFGAAGVVYCNTHALHLNDIRGFGRGKPWLMACFGAGALAIGGVPLWSGYVSKTLLHESLVEYIAHLEHLGRSAGLFRGVEVLFLLSGGLTVAYMTKLFVCLFVQRPIKPLHEKTPYMGAATRAALTAGALAVTVLGLTPGGTMQPIAQLAQPFMSGGVLAHPLHYFSWVNLRGAGISLAVGAAVYCGVIRTRLMTRDGSYVERWNPRLDMEELFYRPLLRVLAFLAALAGRIMASLGDWTLALFVKLLYFRAPKVIIPRQNKSFGTYDQKRLRHPVEDTMSFDLLLAGMGITLVLAYLMIRNLL